MKTQFVADGTSGLPRVQLGEWVTDVFNWLTDNMSGFFSFLSNIIGNLVHGLTSLLQAPNAILMAVIFALLGLVIRGWKFAIAALLGMFLVISMEQWSSAMETLGLVFVATVFAIIISLPLGVLAARSARASAIIRPLMDLMQTMPAFVWLVPVVTLFAIGVVPGVIATIIFALPPGVRFTELGIRNVDEEIVEAANAFGATKRETLFGVQLPLAMPTIMAGVNQVIMLALSMAVIAGLVGAAGLGGQVTSAISTLNLGLGFEAGMSVVILAVYLDRLTSSLAEKKPGNPLKRRKKNGSADVQTDEPGAAAVDPHAPELTTTPTNA